MSRYYYEAVDGQGRRVPGVLECESRERLISILEEKGQTLTAVSLRPVLQARGTSKKLKGGRPGAKERSDLAVQLGRLMETGCPMDRALELATGTVATREMSSALESIRLDVQQGAALSEAMGRHSRIFPPLFLASVKAGEAGGFLAQAFSKLADYEKKQDRLRRKVLSSMLYPSFMIVTLAVSLAVVFIFVVPNLLSFFTKSNMELPAPTKLLIRLSDDFPAIAGGGLAIVFAALGLRWRFGRTPSALEREDRAKLWLPVVGTLVRNLSLGRFCRTLALLLEGGVVLNKALEITREAVTNRVFQREIDTIREQITGGEPLSRCLEVSPDFPETLAGQVRFGEETGSLARVLGSLAEEYEESSEASLDAAVGLVEPLMIVVMGGVMGFVVIALFTPLVSMSNVR